MDPWDAKLEKLYLVTRGKKSTVDNQSLGFCALFSVPVIFYTYFLENLDLKAY